MKSIESYMFYGDNAEVFRPLIGFKIEDIEFTNTNEEKEPVIILGCVNEHHVRIDLLLQEDGVFISEPYAVNEDLSAIRSENPSVSRKKATHTANIDGKTIVECVTSGVSSAIRKSIRDTDEADSRRLK